MQVSFKSSKTAAFTKKTHEIVAVNGSRFHTDHNLWNILQEKHRGNSVNNYFCTIPVVRHRKRTMFTAVGIHEIADVILAADINANIKFVLIHNFHLPSSGFAINRHSATHDTVASSTSLIRIHSGALRCDDPYCL